MSMLKSLNWSNWRRWLMSDEREEQAMRKWARETHDQLAQAQATAAQLPPLHGIKQGEPMMPCATCGDAAPAYKLIEGERIYICGQCILNEMDAWEAQQRTQGDRQ